MSRRAPREPGVTAGAEARGLHGREPGARLGEAGPSHRPAYGKISVCPGGAGGSAPQKRNLGPAGGAETRPSTPCRERVDRRPSQNLWGRVWLSSVTCSGQLP